MGIILSGITLSNSGSPLPISNGGTGATTATGAIDNLLPSQTSNSGKFLTTNGTNVSWATVSGSQPTITDVSGSATAYNIGMTALDTGSLSTLDVTQQSTLVFSFVPNNGSGQSILSVGDPSGAQ